MVLHTTCDERSIEEDLRLWPNAAEVAHNCSTYAPELSCNARDTGPRCRNLTYVLLCRASNYFYTSKYQ